MESPPWRLSALLAGPLPINPTTCGGELQLLKERGLWLLLPAGSSPSCQTFWQMSEWSHLRKEGEAAPSGFPFLNNCLDNEVKTATHPSTGQTQCCLTSVISWELVCQHGWGATPCQNPFCLIPQHLCSPWRAAIDLFALWVVPRPLLVLPAGPGRLTHDHETNLALVGHNRLVSHGREHRLAVHRTVWYWALQNKTFLKLSALVMKSKNVLKNLLLFIYFNFTSCQFLWIFLVSVKYP